jgi:hypothetical protein
MPAASELTPSQQHLEVRKNKLGAFFLAGHRMGI